MDLPALNSLSSQRPLTDEAVTEEVHHNAVRESLMKDKGQADIIRVASAKGNYNWLTACTKFIPSRLFTLAIMPRFGIEHPLLPSKVQCPGCHVLLTSSSAIAHVSGCVKCSGTLTIKIQFLYLVVFFKFLNLMSAGGTRPIIQKRRKAPGKLRETCHEDMSARSVSLSYPQVVISGLERPNLLSARLGFVNFRMSNLRAHGKLRETCHEDLSARSVLVSYPQVVISGLERPNLLSARLGFVNFRMRNLRAHGKLRETCHEDLSARSVLVSYPQVVISGLERPNLLSARLGFVNFRMSNLRAHGKLRETCHEDLSARSVLVSYPQVVISGLERPNLLSARLGFVNFRMSNLRAHGKLRETCHEDLSAPSVLVSYPQVVISGLERPNLLSARLGFVNFRMSNLRAHGKLRET